MYKRVYQDKKPGFTLIELMIVVAIIAFLSMIAVPSFWRFLAKSRRTEAYMNLSALCAHEKMHKAEHGTYTAVLQGKDGLGWKPEGAFNYTYGFPGQEGQSCFMGAFKTEMSHLQGACADKDGFIVYAAGDIDGDGRPDILAVDQSGVIKIITDDLG